MEASPIGSPDPSQAPLPDAPAAPGGSGRAPDVGAAAGGSGEPRRRHRRNGGVVAGIVLVAVGGLLLADRFSVVDIWKLWPLIIVAAGVGIVVRGGDD